MLKGYLGSHYIACVDLEATCCNDESFDRDQMEIIEFGCTVLDPQLNVVGSCNLFVKPVINPTLTDFCKELTTINQSDVDGADNWSTAASQISAFFDQLGIDRSQLIWVSWGDYDRKQIQRDCARHHVVNPMPLVHINLKAVDAKMGKQRKQRGLKRAVGHYKLSFPGTLHRACDDAKAVSMVLQAMAKIIKK